ncbi:hypothetical protein GQ55_2G014700 [Panicum hallii var. hallii]|uniref:Uncharacterized protein n=1 Tax=Panicum hallii var. hallii TaxID=1504633 RepID=A0A2T7EKD8_9POAL|nr:hypothetical protein GQ55_2G014700 [Panicum hallii var. hallii]
MACDPGRAFVEAVLRYEYFDTERRDKSFTLGVALRLSESTDIVGTAIDCLRSSASLLNLAAQDAVTGELTLLSNLQDISDSYAPPWVGFEYCYALFTNFFRPDPLCCQGNGHGPSVKSTMSSELSHLFKEQTFYFVLSCYVPALEYSLPSAFDQAGRNVMTDRTPLKLDVTFAPHQSMHDSFVTEAMGSKQEERFPFGSIQDTVDMTRSRSVDCLICRSEVNDYKVSWFSKHGRAAIKVEKPGTGLVAVPKASGRYNTQSAAKRKR